MKTVAQEVEELRVLKDPWSLIYAEPRKFSVRAVAVFRAICTVASEYRRELDSVADEDLDLLIPNAARSAVKTKLLARRISQRGENQKKS